MRRKLWIILLVLFLPFLGLAIARKKEGAFSKSNLGDYAQYAPWIEAMAKHETGNFKSRIFRELNNAFGMKNAVRRPQLGRQAAGEEFRRYKDIDESVRDLIVYLDFVRFPKNLDTIDMFVRNLKKRKYFEDSYFNYLNGVKSWLQ